MEESTCIFCGREVERLGSQSHEYSFDCNNCGRYKISLAARHYLEQKKELMQDRHLVAGYLREMTAAGIRVDTITSLNWKDILKNASAAAPHTFHEKVGKLLRYIMNEVGAYGVPVTIGYGQPAIAYARNDLEFFAVLKAAERNGLIEFTPALTDCACSLTAEGMAKVDSLNAPRDEGTRLAPPQHTSAMI